jgi:hypothetical protein
LSTGAPSDKPPKIEAHSIPGGAFGFIYPRSGRRAVEKRKLKNSRFLVAYCEKRLILLLNRIAGTDDYAGGGTPAVSCKTRPP